MSILISLIPILFIIPIVILFTIGLPVFIGVFVYKDAKKRDTNALLWALVSAFTPSFIGLIIYLIVRNDFNLTSNNEKSNDEYKSTDGTQETEYVHVDDETEKAEATPNPTKSNTNKIPTWGKVLIVVGISLAVIFLISVCIMIYQFFSVNYLPEVHNYNGWSYLN